MVAEYSSLHFWNQCPHILWITTVPITCWPMLSSIWHRSPLYPGASVPTCMTQSVTLWIAKVLASERSTPQRRRNNRPLVTLRSAQKLLLYVWRGRLFDAPAAGRYSKEFMQTKASTERRFQCNSYEFSCTLFWILIILIRNMNAAREQERLIVDRK